MNAAECERRIEALQGEARAAASTEAALREEIAAGQVKLQEAVAQAGAVRSEVEAEVREEMRSAVERKMREVSCCCWHAGCVGMWGQCV